MTEFISNIGIHKVAGMPSPREQRTEAGPVDDFGKAMKKAIRNVDQLERQANRSIAGLMQGENEVHETMIALQKADLSMRTLLAVRNKVIDAYHEIMRMHF